MQASDDVDHSLRVMPCCTTMHREIWRRVHRAYLAGEACATAVTQAGDGETTWRSSAGIAIAHNAA